MKNLRQKHLLDEIDFALSVCVPREPGKGEDSYLSCLEDRGVLAAVCDGCGGAGAKIYPALRGMTGAYVASRVTTGTLKDCFEAGVFQKLPEEAAEILKERIVESLLTVKQHGGRTGSLKGSLMKEFPSTLAAMSLRKTAGGDTEVSCFWAGDSRCYALVPEGLRQLTADDTGSPDAMDNLTADGVLRNVVSLSRDFTIHSGSFVPELPCLLFTATDGCFAYFPTPMAFEQMLLRSLLQSDGPASWEDAIRAELREVAGDDFSLTGFALGFGSFSAMQNAFRPREAELSELNLESPDLSQEEKTALWAEYRGNYERDLMRREERA